MVERKKGWREEAKMRGPMVGDHPKRERKWRLRK